MNIKGIVFGIIANLLFGLTQPLLRVIYLNYKISPDEVLFWKVLLMLPLNFITMKRYGHNPFNIPKDFRNLTVLRSVAGFISSKGLWMCI
jgi:EamA domain-containing membrane protein RarD